MTALITLLLCVLHLRYYSQCEAKTVVMMPIPTKSYIIFHSNIAKALIDLGHNVSLCVPAYLIDAGLVPYKNVNIIRYGEDLGDVQSIVYEGSNNINHFWEGKMPNFQIMQQLIGTYKKIIEQILSDKIFIQKLRDLKADFFVLDSVFYIQNIMVLPYKLDVPFALINTYADYQLTRTPFSPAGDPSFFEFAGDRKTFFQRVSCALLSVYFYSTYVITDNELVTRFAPERPYKTYDEIALSAEIFIIEQDHILDYPRTALSNTKFVGGSSVGEAKPLSGELKTYVDKSSNGIIIVSFGGGEIHIPSHVIAKMLEAFRNLNQNVVWKINSTFDQPGKVLPLKWIPQNYLLGHEKTKVFISHCGKNGQYEALYHSVPILCLPIYGDQFYNSIRVSTKEFGLYADIREITSDELTGLVKQLIDDPKYKTNMQKVSKLFKALFLKLWFATQKWVATCVKVGRHFKNYFLPKEGKK